jgi:ribosomal protein S18 acetylase RimI-like enzyme
VRRDNERALRLYQQLGFRHRSTGYYLAYDLA